MNKELIEKVNGYLTKQFIGEPSDLPEDECRTEAKYLVSLISVGAERVGYFRGYQHRAEVHTEIINHEAVTEERKQERERMVKFLMERATKIGTTGGRFGAVDISTKDYLEILISLTPEDYQALKEGKEAE